MFDHMHPLTQLLFIHGIGKHTAGSEYRENTQREMSVMTPKSVKMTTQKQNKFWCSCSKYHMEQSE
jgi:hypothetical protein